MNLVIPKEERFAIGISMLGLDRSDLTVERSDYFKLEFAKWVEGLFGKAMDPERLLPADDKGLPVPEPYYDAHVENVRRGRAETALRNRIQPTLGPGDYTLVAKHVYAACSPRDLCYPRCDWDTSRTYEILRKNKSLTVGTFLDEFNASRPPEQQISGGESLRAMKVVWVNAAVIEIPQSDQSQ